MVAAGRKDLLTMVRENAPGDDKIATSYDGKKSSTQVAASPATRAAQDTRQEKTQKGIDVSNISGASRKHCNL